MVNHVGLDYLLKPAFKAPPTTVFPDFMFENGNPCDTTNKLIAQPAEETHRP